MDLKRCADLGFIKPASKDLDLVKSLKQSSKNKAVSAALLDINETTIPSIITLYYASLRELLEALAIMKNFKIYNHQCFTSFLKEVLNEEQSAIKFDRIRKIRNSLNYYGESLSLEDANFIISDIKELINNCNKILEKEVKSDV